MSIAYGAGGVMERVPPAWVNVSVPRTVPFEGSTHSARYRPGAMANENRSRYEPVSTTYERAETFGLSPVSVCS